MTAITSGFCISVTDPTPRPRRGRLADIDPRQLFLREIDLPAPHAARRKRETACEVLVGRVPRQFEPDRRVRPPSGDARLGLANGALTLDRRAVEVVRGGQVQRRAEDERRGRGLRVRARNQGPGRQQDGRRKPKCCPDLLGCSAMRGDPPHLSDAACARCGRSVSTPPARTGPAGGILLHRLVHHHLERSRHHRRAAGLSVNARSAGLGRCRSCLRGGVAALLKIS